MDTTCTFTTTNGSTVRVENLSSTGNYLSPTLFFSHLCQKIKKTKLRFKCFRLDIGEGKEVNLVEKCPRLKLQQQCIKYLGPVSIYFFYLLNK